MRHERGGTAPAARADSLLQPRTLPGARSQGKAVLSESIDDLTVEYEENGQVILKELGKIVLSKGAWTTILFRYQEWKPQTSSYGPDKYVIRRYKKVGGEYRQQSKFTISSADQARRSWMPCRPGSERPGRKSSRDSLCLPQGAV